MADSSHCFYYPFIVGIPFATRVRVPYICAPCRVVSRPSPSRRLPHHIQAHSIIFTPPPLFRYSLCIPSHERLRLIYSPARASLIPLTLGLRDYFWIFHILSTPPPFVLVSGYILSTVISKLIPNQNRAI